MSKESLNILPEQQDKTPPKQTFADKMKENTAIQASLFHLYGPEPEEMQVERMKNFAKQEDGGNLWQLYWLGFYESTHKTRLPVDPVPPGKLNFPKQVLQDVSKQKPIMLNVLEE